MSNPQENNIGLVAGGLIGLGCLTALGVGLITLPVAIGIGAVVAGGFGAKELINMRGEKKAIDPNQARYEKAPQQGFKEVNQERGSLNEDQHEGKRIGEEIALEHLLNPRTTKTNSRIIQKYQLEEIKQNLSPQQKKNANFKLRVAQAAKELAINFTDKPTISTDMLEDYKKDFIKKAIYINENTTSSKTGKNIINSVKLKAIRKNVTIQLATNEYNITTIPERLRENAIATSAFDEVANVITAHQQKPSSNLGSPSVKQERRENIILL
jgi:hypothetical protein